MRAVHTAWRHETRRWDPARRWGRKIIGSTRCWGPCVGDRRRVVLLASVVALVVVVVASTRTSVVVAATVVVIASSTTIVVVITASASVVVVAAHVVVAALVVEAAAATSTTTAASTVSATAAVAFVLAAYRFGFAGAEGGFGHDEAIEEDGLVCVLRGKTWHLVVDSVHVLASSRRDIQYDLPH